VCKPPVYVVPFLTSLTVLWLVVLMSLRSYPKQFGQAVAAMAVRLQKTSPPALVELVDGDSSDDGDDLYLTEFFGESIEDQWIDVVNLMAK
jgi:hypothetical protein